MLELAKDVFFTTHFTITMRVLTAADMLEQQVSSDMMEMTWVSLIRYTIYYRIVCCFFYDENSFVLSRSVRVSPLRGLQFITETWWVGFISSYRGWACLCTFQASLKTSVCCLLPRGGGRECQGLE